VHLRLLLHNIAASDAIADGTFTRGRRREMRPNLEKHATILKKHKNPFAARCLSDERGGAAARRPFTQEDQY
jgi:hypothetical protein